MKTVIQHANSTKEFRLFWTIVLTSVRERRNLKTGRKKVKVYFFLCRSTCKNWKVDKTTFRLLVKYSNCLCVSHTVDAWLFSLSHEFGPFCNLCLWFSWNQQLKKKNRIISEYTTKRIFFFFAKTSVYTNWKFLHKNCTFPCVCVLGCNAEKVKCISLIGHCQRSLKATYLKKRKKNWQS